MLDRLGEVPLSVGLPILIASQKCQQEESFS